jgi:hypothetical protein
MYVSNVLLLLLLFSHRLQEWNKVSSINCRTLRPLFTPRGIFPHTAGNLKRKRKRKRRK